jgi:hypothetical protein
LAPATRLRPDIFSTDSAAVSGNTVELAADMAETAAIPTWWYVSLDPDGWLAGAGWLYVVVRAETGVIYQQQYGGTACRQGRVEGFLVPVFGLKGLSLLRELFEGHFGGAGTWSYRWQADEV